jgi:hypothetical protein
VEYCLSFQTAKDKGNFWTEHYALRAACFYTVSAQGDVALPVLRKLTREHG